MRRLALYFLKLGTTGFGGPIALVGAMERDLVPEQLSPEEFREGLALAQLAPGPLAAQLAMYIGWLSGGVLGATVTGLAFIAPSFLMVLALSAAYVRTQGMPWMQGAFYGIGAAVIAIIAKSAVRLVKMTAGRDALLWALCAVSAAVTAATGRELVLVVIASGLVAMLRRGPRGEQGTAPLDLLLYFAGAGLFVFGSGLAIIPFLHGGTVQQYHWLTERQFLDAVAVSMITPGPVVITVAFIGWLVAGLAGAVAAAVGVFVPVWAIVVIAAPHYRRLIRRDDVATLVRGVTAAAAGAIAGAAVVLGRRAIVDLPTVLIAAATLGLLLLKKKPPEPALIALAGAAGILLRSS